MRKNLLFSLVLMLLATVSADAVTITGQGGWFESAYVTWQKESGMEYNVYVSPAESSSWKKLDDELVREYPSYGRADALGLAAGSYMFKVVPVQNGVEQSGEAVSEAVTVKAHDRTGFAHQAAGSEGIGAYNNDGTLKSDARVLYVWADNAKTVSLSVYKDNKGNEETFTGLQAIMNAFQKGCETRPLAVRIVGTIKDSDMDGFESDEGLQIKGRNGYSKLNITLEGVGNDATIWGFGMLLRYASMVEVRNIGIMLCMDDCVSIDTKNSMIWVHNVDFFYGNTGSDADQAKGDGALDYKGGSKDCTFSYNHFYDSGKCNLGGMGGDGDDVRITIHHTWFDHSDSRHPRIRGMFHHIFNNYYDGNSKYGVGMTSGGSALVESNYFRNCKYPMLISQQGTDAEGDGTFSGDAGGVIKSFNNVMLNPRKCVTYQQNSEQWDCYEVSSLSETIPSTVKCSTGTGYSNYDTSGSMYSWTSDAPADVPAIVTGQYGAGRIQHGDFDWQFNNSVQDENYAVISELKSALQSYRSTLVGFFDGISVKNGGAPSTVKGGDGQGISDEVNDSYVPSWGAGGGSGQISNGLPDPRFCGAETEAGSKQYDYVYFNNDSKTAIDGYINDGWLALGAEDSFKPELQPAASSDGSVSCDYTGVLEIKKGSNVTFKCENGLLSVSALIYRTGDAKGEIQVSKDGTSFTKIGDYSQKKGVKTISAATEEKEGPVWVRITNGSSGTLYVIGVKMMYPDANGSSDTPDPDSDPTPSASHDASADITLNDDLLIFSGNTATQTIAYNDPTTSYTVEVTPADGASIMSVSGAELSGNSYTFSAPEMGQTTTVTFTIVAEDGYTTKTYTIKVVREVDPSTIPVETGNIMLQSDNIPEGYKLDGSSSVTAYSYSSDLCNGANLIKVAAGQHTVTLAPNAKVTKIVMYAVGDNNTANKGKITELAGQTFEVNLVSRKTGTDFSKATVENVNITGEFTFSVTYAAGVKFALTVETATGISEIVTIGGNDATVYDLQGRRVETPLKGQLYIQNGRKFIQK